MTEVPGGPPGAPVIPDMPESAVEPAAAALCELHYLDPEWARTLARAALEAAAPVLAQSQRAGIAASLRRAAAGRREYAAGGGQEEATALLLRSAECYESAARIIEDPRHLMSVIPSWRWTEEESASLHQREIPQ